jgi:hypothetical protein
VRLGGVVTNRHELCGLTVLLVTEAESRVL